MLSYLHILIRVEDDGSLHAIGAFTSKEKQLAYQKESGLEDNQVRLDFYDGPFDENIKDIYVSHRRWNMELFQLGGYFKRESDAWASITQEGYVNVLRIDVTYEEEKLLEQEALQEYAKLQRRWKLASYEELVARQGAEKARANIKLRLYQDAPESFQPETRQNSRSLYTLAISLLFLLIALVYFFTRGPDYGENRPAVDWLPDYASNISYYRSKQVQVFEFTVKGVDFKHWAESRGMRVRQLVNQEIISRYKAYIPAPADQSDAPPTPAEVLSPGQFESWQNNISAKINSGLIAEGPGNAIAIHDANANKAYYEQFVNF